MFSRTRSEVGRVSRPRGAASLCPLRLPAMTRMGGSSHGDLLPRPRSLARRLVLGSVRAELEARGHVVHTPDLPCEDVDAGVEEYAAAVPAADVVVGHSLGGFTIPLRRGAHARLPHRGRRRHRRARRLGAGLRRRPACATSWAARTTPIPRWRRPSSSTRPSTRTWRRGSAGRLRSPARPVAVESPVYIVCARDAVIRPEWQRHLAQDVLGVEAGIELDAGPLCRCSSARAELARRLAPDGVCVSGGAAELFDLAMRLAVDPLQPLGIGRSRRAARRRPRRQREEPHASASGSTSAKSAAAASCNGPGSDSRRRGARPLEQVAVAAEMREAEVGEARLPRAEQRAAAAQLEVDLGELEAVARVARAPAAGRAPTRSAPPSRGRRAGSTTARRRDRRGRGAGAAARARSGRPPGRSSPSRSPRRRRPRSPSSPRARRARTP